ncbi:hypothetical protein V6N12_042521 [Hibiscus sabdariffa]|uniref:Uncharacterized protein n=1 Tax=Hibiscus sabdariffa TaxID=183260 RepID=A0ABR2EF14_9ROSI
MARSNRSGAVDGSRFNALLVKDTVENRETIWMGNIIPNEELSALNATYNKGGKAALNQPQVPKNVAYRKSSPTIKSKEVIRGDDITKLAHVSVDQEVVVIS